MALRGYAEARSHALLWSWRLSTAYNERVHHNTRRQVLCGCVIEKRLHHLQASACSALMMW